MKKITSIKTRITIWYTTLMLVLIAFVLIIVGTVSYRQAIDNVEKDVMLRVSRISEKPGRGPMGMLHDVNTNRDFKNVSIHSLDGEYMAGQYMYDIANIEFKEGRPRRETVDGKEYIIYDIKRPAPPGMEGGFWIRGFESVNSTVILGRMAFMSILVIVPLVLLLTALGGYFITRKAFMPINSIVDTANKICTKNDIKQRIDISPNAKKDELNNLAVTLNTMLDKIENLIIQEKQFTSDASHELRTPVSVILAQGEYLLDIADTEKERELAQNIVDKANQVSKLISRLLLMARIDGNRQKLKYENVDLCLVADIAAENVRDMAETKNITISVDIGENTVVYADEILLISILENLIGNGIKYGKNGGFVKVMASNEEDFVCISVIDDGVGIPKDQLDKIWGRFYRIDNVRNDEYGSNGLGLSMVKSITELHGGNVSVESEDENGSIFTVKLPLFNKNDENE